jgi:hypothetical protein
VPIGISPAAYYGIMQRFYRNIRRSLDIPLHSPLDRSYLGYYLFTMDYSANDVINRIQTGVYNREDLIILGFHELLPNGGYDANNCPPEVFAEIVHYLSERGYRVMTLKDAMDYLLPGN